jgi:hypothetical protein
MRSRIETEGETGAGRGVRAKKPQRGSGKHRSRSDAGTAQSCKACNAGSDQTRTFLHFFRKWDRAKKVRELPSGPVNNDVSNSLRTLEREVCSLKPVSCFIGSYLKIPDLAGRISTVRECCDKVPGGLDREFCTCVSTHPKKNLHPFESNTISAYSSLFIVHIAGWHECCLNLS